MTIIAYRDGVMASDSLIQANGVTSGMGRKITKTKQGFLVGGSGSFSNISLFLDWWEDEAEDKPPLNMLKIDTMNGIVVSKDGVLTFDSPDMYPMEIKAKFHTLGCGSEIATGAMEMGATAEEAVKIAIKYLGACGGKVQIVRL